MGIGIETSFDSHSNDYFCITVKVIYVYISITVIQKIIICENRSFCEETKQCFEYNLVCEGKITLYDNLVYQGQIIFRDHFFIQKRLKNTKQKADDTSMGSLLPSKASHTSHNLSHNLVYKGHPRTHCLWSDSPKKKTLFVLKYSSLFSFYDFGQSGVSRPWNRREVSRMVRNG